MTGWVKRRKRSARNKKGTGVLLGVFLCVPTCWKLGAAPVSSTPDKGAPLEITAQKEIFCSGGKNYCTAEGQARARKGHLTVEADHLRVFFKPKEQTKTPTPSSSPAAAPTASSAPPSRTPSFLIATGHVILRKLDHSQKPMAQAERAFYDVSTGVLTLKDGPELSTNDGCKLTSSHPIIYRDKENRGEAFQALLVHSVRQVAMRGERFVLMLDPQPASSPRGVQTVTAHGNVLMVSPQHTCRAQQAVYNVQAKTITLTGDVEVEDGKNLVGGEQACLSLEKGQETVHFYPTPGQQRPLPSSSPFPSRVRALLIPKPRISKVRS